MTTYQVTATRDGDWWSLVAPELDQVEVSDKTLEALEREVAPLSAPRETAALRAKACVRQLQPRHASGAGRPFPMSATFTFVTTSTGTAVTCNSDLRPTGLWRLLAPVIAREGRKTDVQQFRNAKRILEGRTAEPSG